MIRFTKTSCPCSHSAICQALLLLQPSPLRNASHAYEFSSVVRLPEALGSMTAILEVFCDQRQAIYLLI
jgi:hypothetical protein